MEYDEGTEQSERKPETAAEESVEGVDPSRAKLVAEWQECIKAGKEHMAPDFKRMRKCMQIARDGDEKDWVKSGKYVAPVLNRHISQAVSQLYAKHPRPVVSRRDKVYFRLWDGKPETAQQAVETVMMQTSPLDGMPMTPAAAEAKAVIDEIMAAQQDIQLLDRMARTMEVVDKYFMGEQARNYKAQLKKLVRRTKVTAVGYVELGFQRLLGEEQDPNLDPDAKIEDIRPKIEQIEETMALGEKGDLTEDSPRVEQLRSDLADLEQRDTVIVREGPVLSFLKSTQVIIDPACYHLKTFAGARWIAIEYDETPERILHKFGVDIGKKFAGYAKKNDRKGKKSICKVWKVYDQWHQQMFVIADGYPDFLRAPQTPDVKLDRFWPVFALVFNESEEDDEDENASVIPLSDVWLARHAQQEYNRSREGLRQHRIAARPYYVTPKQILEEQDKTKLAHHADHEVIELNIPATEDFDITKIVQRGPVAPIDPNLYDTEIVFNDVLRTIGSQEANLGGTAGGTATESSIAESSRMSTIDDNVDDLDEFLSELAHARGQLYLLELSADTVREIAGPGAVWPEQQPTREQVAKDLLLDIKAGSSGRPNKASELANLERAMPFILQLPGLNPKPYLDRYNALLDIETDEATAEGLPSVMALNAMVSRAAAGAGAQPTGDPASDPNAQGAAGADNAPAPAGTAPGAQPAYPVPGEMAQ